GDIDVTLQFAVRVGEQDAACGQSYMGVGAAATTIEFLDIRFFVSNVRLVDDAGAEVPVALEDDGEWQLEGSALLDFEDGSAGCSENTTVETNTTLRGTVPDGTYTGVRFDLGLPFEQNHLNADEAPPPLNTTAMFWSWAAGYKFAKIDIANDNPGPNNRWNFHLGSQACDNGGAGPTIPPPMECGRPGRPAIALDGFDPLTGTVVLDAAALYDGVDVTSDTPMSSPGCMSFMPDVNECIDLFPNLGLSWDTGDCVDGCANQIAFHGE
ncbi:MAG: metallo-mystery pair system four-Cys motif protein, partial [Myxococcales bacterium]|nr:metallo-mystery pair system four-Cys motif protein [Myxococcales bacterium]